MYSIKILENAYISAIELAERCTPNSLSDCRDIYHIIKLVRASVRDFPEITDKTMFDTLGMHAARLRKMAGGKINPHMIVDNDGEVFPLPISNSYGSLTCLISRKLREKDVGSFTHLHKIADLCVQRFFEYSDWVDAHSDTPEWNMTQYVLCGFYSILGRYVGYLECAMKINDIPYGEIIV